MVNHWWLALERLLELIYSSWMMQMLYLYLFKLVSRSSWVYRDLLVFFCLI